ncbi:MAG: ECF transporter S component [Clostridia bacterium]|nr:ECF transporter S component [Clostridia bacterium]
MNKKREISQHISLLTRMALLAAIIFVLTSSLKIPTATGYVHLGDAAVCFAAVLLPTPFALVTAALGASLADLAAGYPQWIIITALIKAAMTLAFSSKGGKLLCPRNYIALIAAVLINALGYYLGGSFMYGNFTVSLSEIPSNLLQGAVGALIFLVLCGIIDKNESLRRLLRGR